MLYSCSTYEMHGGGPLSAPHVSSCPAIARTSQSMNCSISALASCESALRAPLVEAKKWPRVEAKKWPRLRLRARFKHWNIRDGNLLAG